MGKLGRARVTVGIIVVVFGFVLFLINLLPILSGSTADFYQLSGTFFLVVLGIVLILLGKLSRTEITRDWLLFSLRLNIADLIFDIGVIAAIGVFFFYVYLSSIGLTDPMYMGTLIFFGLLASCLIVLGSYLWVRAWQQRPKGIWAR